MVDDLVMHADDFNHLVISHFSHALNSRPWIDCSIFWARNLRMATLEKDPSRNFFEDHPGLDPILGWLCHSHTMQLHPTKIPPGDGKVYPVNIHEVVPEIFPQSTQQFTKL